MAWDASRPVPWNRLFKEWLIYSAILAVVFALVFRGNAFSIVAGLIISGPIYLAFGYVLAKFGYQRKTLSEMRTPPRNDDRFGTRVAPSTGADAADVRRVQSATAEWPQAAMTAVIAIDAGTTGIRSRAVFDDDRPVVAAYREFTQHFPRPGWVEHDPAEIWEAVRATLNEVVEAVGAAEVAAIGITNQRETAVAWDRSTGKPYGNAIVWQDRRTAGRCAELASSPGVLDRVRQRTGLVLDPVLQRDEVGVAAARRRRARERRPRPRHGRHLGDLEPHGRRGPRHGSHQRQPHDAVRHPRSGVGRRAV